MGFFSPTEDERLARLTRRAQRGDREAFRSLYRALYPRVTRFIGRRVSSRADAEDLAAQVFERFLQRLEQVEPQGVSAFALTSARNAVFDYLRTTRPSEPAEAADLLASGDPDPLGRLIASEDLAAVRRALRELSGQDRELISLRVGDGLKHSEIAAVLGISEEAVKQRFSRALRAVREAATALRPEGGLTHEAR